MLPHEIQTNTQVIMSKSMKNKDNVEAFPPKKKTGLADKDDPLQMEGKTPQARLVTTGQIKSELGKIYRLVRKGDMDPRVAYSLQFILRTMLKATEQEHVFALAADDPDDDTPSLVGVTIIGPGATRADLKKLTSPAQPTRKRGSE